MRRWYKSKNTEKEIVFSTAGMILLELIKDGPLEIKELARRVGRSESRVAFYLRVMLSYGLVDVSIGNWFATPKARKLFKEICEHVSPSKQ